MYSLNKLTLINVKRVPQKPDRIFFHTLLFCICETDLSLQTTSFSLAEHQFWGMMLFNSLSQKLQNQALNKILIIYWVIS